MSSTWYLQVKIAVCRLVVALVTTACAEAGTASPASLAAPLPSTPYDLLLEAVVTGEVRGYITLRPGVYVSRLSALQLEVTTETRISLDIRVARSAARSGDPFGQSAVVHGPNPLRITRLLLDSSSAVGLEVAEETSRIVLKPITQPTRMAATARTTKLPQFPLEDIIVQTLGHSSSSGFWAADARQKWPVLDFVLEDGTLLLAAGTVIDYAGQHIDFGTGASARIRNVRAVPAESISGELSIAIQAAQNLRLAFPGMRLTPRSGSVAAGASIRRTISEFALRSTTGSPCSLDLKDVACAAGDPAMELNLAHAAVQLRNIEVKQKLPSGKPEWHGEATTTVVLARSRVAIAGGDLAFSGGTVDGVQLSIAVEAPGPKFSAATHNVGLRDVQARFRTGGCETVVSLPTATLADTVVSGWNDIAVGLQWSVLEASSVCFVKENKDYVRFDLSQGSQFLVSDAKNLEINVSPSPGKVVVGKGTLDIKGRIPAATISTSGRTARFGGLDGRVTLDVEAPKVMGELSLVVPKVDVQAAIDQLIAGARGRSVGKAMIDSARAEVDQDVTVGLRVEHVPKENRQACAVEVRGSGIRMKFGGPGDKGTGLAITGTLSTLSAAIDLLKNEGTVESDMGVALESRTCIEHGGVSLLLGTCDWQAGVGPGAATVRVAFGGKMVGESSLEVALRGWRQVDDGRFGAWVDIQDPLPNGRGSFRLDDDEIAIPFKIAGIPVKTARKPNAAKQFLNDLVNRAFVLSTSK